MNTLTIVILVVCATAAFASALPGNPASDIEALAAAAPAEELLQGDESRSYGGHGGYNHGGGGYYRGGSGYYRGGGGYNRGGGGYHGGRGWGK